METTIKWNANLFGVEIQTKNEHFVISAQPSMAMNWNDAVRYFEGNKEWELPTQEQLQVVVSNIVEVNEIIKANGGFEIRGWLWSVCEYDKFCAWLVYMGDGETGSGNKGNLGYVRAVSAL